MNALNPLTHMTIGDRVEASVVVATGLSIAFISQQQHELFTPEEFKFILKYPFIMLSKLKSLNIQGMRSAIERELVAFDRKTREEEVEVAY